TCGQWKLVDGCLQLGNDIPEPHSGQACADGDLTGQIPARYFCRAGGSHNVGNLAEADHGLAVRRTAHVAAQSDGQKLERGKIIAKPFGQPYDNVIDVVVGRSPFAHVVALQQRSQRGADVLQTDAEIACYIALNAYTQHRLWIVQAAFNVDEARNGAQLVGQLIGKTFQHGETFALQTDLDRRGDTAHAACGTDYKLGPRNLRECGPHRLHHVLRPTITLTGRQHAGDDGRLVVAAATGGIDGGIAALHFRELAQGFVQL